MSSLLLIPKWCIGTKWLGDHIKVQGWWNISSHDHRMETGHMVLLPILAISRAKCFHLVNSAVVSRLAT